VCKSLRFLTIPVMYAATLLLGTSPSQAQFGGSPGRVVQPQPFPPNRMPGWDWWRTYPWSPYNYGRNPYNPAWYPYVAPYPVYPPDATAGYAPNTSARPGSSYSAGYYSQQELLPDPTGKMSSPPPGAALIRLYVSDPFAAVWFDGVQTSSVGTTRYYVTPELEDKQYHYQVKARWRRNGQFVTEERRIDVGPDKTAVVDFTKAAAGR